MIKIFRSIIGTFCLVLFGLGGVFIRYFVFPFQKDKIQNHKTLKKSWMFYIKMLEILNVARIDVDKDTYEKLTNIKQSIIVSTHPSFLDVVVLMSIIPKTTCFVAKKIGKNPFFKGMAESLFIVDDCNDIENWLDKACQKLDEGFNLIIFPTGSRHRKDEHVRIKRGASLIAQKSKRNILPVIIKTDIDFMPKNRPFYDMNIRCPIFNIDVLDEINTEEYIEQYKNEVDFRTIVTKKIKEALFEGKI